MGPMNFGVDQETLSRYVDEIVHAANDGIEIGIVVGGGNLFRGLQGSAQGMNRSRADSIGMLATLMNAITLVDALQRVGQGARAFSSVSMPKFMELFTYRAATESLMKGEILVFGGGTGNPYFTTDSAAALRAAEIGATELLKATQVDGIYNADPKKDPNAKRYAQLSFQDCLDQGLKVMDSTAFGLCQAESIPLRVFELGPSGDLYRALIGAPIGTRVDRELDVQFS